jgi:hypothetical protein
MATHAPRFVTLELPRPGRAALPLLALALVALVLVVDRQLRLAGLAAAGCFALAGAVRAARARTELRSVRRVADRLILADAFGAEGSDVVRWRTLELVAPASREELARELGQTLRLSDPGRLPSAAPLRRGVARRHEELLHKLEERMRDGRPVTARGVLLLRRLLREPGSPLYDDLRERELPRAIATVLAELEP